MLYNTDLTNYPTLKVAVKEQLEDKDLQDRVRKISKILAFNELSSFILILFLSVYSECANLVI